MSYMTHMISYVTHAIFIRESYGVLRDYYDDIRTSCVLQRESYDVLRDLYEFIIDHTRSYVNPMISYLVHMSSYVARMMS